MDHGVFKHGSAVSFRDLDDNFPAHWYIGAGRANEQVARDFSRLDDLFTADISRVLDRRSHEDKQTRLYRNWQTDSNKEGDNFVVCF